VVRQELDEHLGKFLARLDREKFRTFRRMP
jgi:hypothetical protein